MLKDSSKGDDVEVVTVIDREDEATLERVIQFSPFSPNIVTVDGHPDPVFKWNEGAKVARGNWLMLGADDLLWTRNWIAESLNTEGHHGFLAFRDNPRSDKAYEPHYMATRDWLKKYNGGVLCIPHYKHWYIDVEIASRALRAGHYKVSRAILPHKHYLFGTAPVDSTYDKAKPYYSDDCKIYAQRLEQCFPNDFESYL